MNNEQLPNNPKRIEALDVIRGFSILIVLHFHFVGEVWSFDHYKWDGDIRLFQPTALSITNVLLYPLTLGWSGVSIFFVLSGFVVHYSEATKYGPFRALTYCSRRGWRILPAYYVALAVFVALSLRIYKFDLGDFAAHLFLVHNWVAEYYFRYNASFWSLALEVQFYLLYLGFRLVGNKVTIPALLILSFAVSALSRWWLASRNPCESVINSYWASLPVLWVDWVFGAFLADRAVRKKPVFRLPLLWFFFFAAVTLLASLYKPTNGLTFSLASLTAGPLIEFWVTRTERLTRFESYIARIGAISYSMYLYHQPILQMTAGMFRKFGYEPMSSLWHLAIVYAACATLTCIISAASYYLVERGIPILLRR